MKFALFIMALCFSLTFNEAACADPIKVMSWNIRYNNPGDGVNSWPHRKDWVAEIVSNNKIDIAGFQEVLVDQFEDLKQRLPEMEAYGVGRDDGRNSGEFSPIFFRKSRFELQQQGTFWLSPSPDQVGSKGWDAALPRIASWVQLHDRQTDQSFYMINTHFDHRGSEARLESARLLVRIKSDKFYNHPVILSSDFNTTPESAPYESLTTQCTEDIHHFVDARESSTEPPAGPNTTWNGFEAIVPDRRIDFVFTTGEIKVLRFRILEDQRDGRFPSDHLPVVTELQLPE